MTDNFDIQIESESTTLGAGRKVVSVSQLTRMVRFTLEDQFSSVWVEGEISGFTHHASGHMYFSIKDAEASVQCVCFARDNARIKFKPENGMKVVVHGRVSIYAPRGQYQLIADMLEPKGLGALQAAFEQLKKRLADEGLFDIGRKRKIPYLPSRIGIVTSLTGAVLHDIQNILDRRFPDAHLIIRPTLMQGETAKEDIVAAITEFNEYGQVDVIILARGGGSLEDLWAFNEEITARAIFASQIPIISAIGHEVDFTIADFVADLRAPTPSAAAELILPEKEALTQLIEGFEARLHQSLERRVEDAADILRRALESRPFANPESLFDPHRQRVDDLIESMDLHLNHLTQTKRQEFQAVVGKLEALSPVACLARGYSIVFDAEKRGIIKSAQSLKSGQQIRIRLSDGEKTARVE